MISKEMIIEILESKKISPHTYPISCPDGRIGCLVLHYSSDKRLDPEERQFNDRIDEIILEIKNYEF